MPPEQPTLEQVRQLLRSASLDDVAAGDVSYLGDGWDCWAFLAGREVVRLPRLPRHAEKLSLEAKLAPVIAPYLPLPIPLLEFHGLPDGGGFTTHELVPGVPLRALKRSPSSDFGAQLGRFMKALHSVPLEKLAGLGLEVFDGSRARGRLIGQYEEIARRAFPLLSCEARTHVVRVFEDMVNDPISFAYEPALVHSDIDDRNVLADPVTGDLTGVIDFGDAEIGNPAYDFAAASAGMFEALGIKDQLPALFREAGFDEVRMGGWQDFTSIWWPLFDVLHGLDTDEPDFIESGITALNAVVPFGVRC
jgi:aminoglycoside 2''-phosphotransferase